MKRARVILNFVVAALVVTGLSGCSYNKFTTQEEAIKASWGEVQNQLLRRNDLIPNLVETVKGYAAQEKEIFTRIADSRARLAGAKTPEETIAAANEQSSALARLLVVVENYPNLKSDANFQRLMDELSGTENRIAVARGRYNEKIQEVQHDAPAVSLERDGQDLRVRGVSLLRRSDGRAAGAEGQFREPLKAFTR